jgi:hypothetical protein
VKVPENPIEQMAQLLPVVLSTSSNQHNQSIIPSKTTPLNPLDKRKKKKTEET